MPVIPPTSVTDNAALDLVIVEIEGDFSAFMKDKINYALMDFMSSRVRMDPTCRFWSNVQILPSLSTSQKKEIIPLIHPQLCLVQSDLDALLTDARGWLTNMVRAVGPFATANMDTGHVDIGREAGFEIGREETLIPVVEVGCPH